MAVTRHGRLGQPVWRFKRSPRSSRPCSNCWNRSPAGRRELVDMPGGAYHAAVLASKPVAYWRFDEFTGPTALDTSGNNCHGLFENGVVFYLEGVDQGGFAAQGGPTAPSISPADV